MADDTQTLPLSGLVASRPDLANPPGLANLPDPAKFKSVDQVHQEYQSWLDQNPNGPPIDLPTWAKGMDSREGGRYRQAAYGTPFTDELPIPEFFKSVQHNPDSPHLQDLVQYLGDALFSNKPLPVRYGGSPESNTPAGIFANETSASGKVGGTVGGLVDKVLGTGNQVRQVGQQVGEGFPRTMASAAIGGPVGMMTDSAANTYGETGSPGSAAVSAGLTGATLGLSKIGGQLGEKVVSDQLAKMITPAADEAGQTLNRGVANEMLTGALPKAGRVVGAVTGGVAGQELGHQVQTGGSNPFTVQNIASDVMSGAMMALPESVDAIRGKGSINSVGQQRLADWVNEQSQKYYQDKGAGTQQEPFKALLRESISRNDTDPEWRKSMVVQGVQDLGGVTDPQERAGRISQLANAIMSSKGIGGVADQAEQVAKMAYVKPPTDIVGLTDLVKRANLAQNDALARMDEMAASGEKDTPSAAAFRQLKDQGFIKDEINLDWLKKEFGDNVERSLANSYSSAYGMLVQKIANRMITIADVAKQARDESLTQRSIETPGVSSSLLEDRRITSGFVDALSKIRDPQLLGELYDRFNYHEELDNKTNRGTAPKFMQEMTDVINQIASGKGPEELAGLNWRNTPATLQKRVSTTDEQGVETRSVQPENVTLGDYLAKDFEGRYTKPVYGRPAGQSQREISIGFDPVAVPQPEAGESVIKPTEDWNAMAHQVRGQLDQMDNRVVWQQVIAPSVMNSLGRVHPAIAQRLAPMAKDLAMAVFEAGTPVKKGEEGSRVLGEAGKRVLAALGQGGTDDRSDYGTLVKRLNTIFGQGGRDATQVRQEIVKRLADKAGVQGGGVEASLAQPMKVPLSPGGIGASRTGNANADVYRLAQNFYRRLGYEPELVDRFTALNLRVLQQFQNPDLQVGALSKNLAYPKTDKNLVPSFDELSMAGFHAQYEGSPVIALASEHYEGSSPKALAAYHFSSVLLHELIHDIQAQARDYDGLTPPTVYSRERIGAYQQLAQAAKFYTPDQKYNFLKTVADATIPRDFLYDSQGNINQSLDGNLRYGAGKFSQPVPDYEFVNTFAQLVGVGMITGGQYNKLSPDQVFMHMPEEQALFAKGVYRDLHDNLEALKTAMKGRGDSPFSAEQMGWLINKTHQMVVSTQPAESMAQANALVQALEGRQWPGPMGYVTAEFPDWANLDEARVRAASQASKELQLTLFGDPKEPAPQVPGSTPPVTPDKQMSFTFEEDGPEARPEKIDIGAYWKTLGLVQQSLDHLTRRGLPLSNDLGDTWRGYIPMQNRMSTSMWAPFLTKNGKFDTTNPLIAAIHDKSLQGRRDVAARNKILAWQQKNESSALEQNPSGQWQLTDKAKNDLGDMDVNQRVVGGVKALEEVGHSAGVALVESRQDSISFRVARLLMAVQPREFGPLPYDKAYNDAQKVVQGMLYNQQATALQGLEPYQQPVRDTIMDFLNGGIMDRLKELQNQVQARTWWVSEQRPGTHLVESYKDNVRHVDGAENAFQARQMKTRLEAQGFTNVSIVSKSERAKVEGFDSPEAVLRNFIKVEQDAFDRYLDQNPQKLSPEQISTLRSFGPAPGEATESLLERRGLNKYLVHRSGVPSAEGLDYADVMRDYISRLTGTIARQHLRQKVDLILSDDRLKGQDDLKLFMDRAMTQLLLPSGKLERSSKAFLGGYYLAANISSVVVNMFDAVNTLPETLVSQGADVTNAFGHVMDGLKDTVFFGQKDNADNVRQTYLTAQQKLSAGQALTKDEKKMYAYSMAIANKQIDKGLLHDIFEDQDTKALAAKVFGTRGEVNISDQVMSADGMYRLVRSIMRLPRFIHQFNNQVGYMAGLNMALDNNMPIDKAMLHADKIRSLGLFAGGKSNMPSYMGMFGNDKSIPVFRTMHTLQQYVYGIAGRWVNDMSDSVSQDKNLTPQQKVQARKALGTLTITALATAGILGLPGVAAVMVIAEKAFGVPVEEALRKGIAHLVGADKDNTGMRGLITETAMNGIPNQALGVNVGSRIGMGNSFGLSTYDGFNLSDLAGPAPSVVENIVSGLGYIAQGDTQKGVTSLAPAFLKRAVNVAFNKSKFGDFKFRDPQGQELLSPSNTQLVSYLAGFNPSALTERQRVRQMITQSNQRYEKDEQRKQNEAARQLIRGNNQPAQQWSQEQLQANPHQAMTDPLAPMRSLADRAVRLQSTPDPLASVPAGNAREAQAIAQTYPSQAVPRQKEVDQLQQRMQLEAHSGAPRMDYSQAYARAVMMDKFEERGMTKAQAERLVVMLGL